jgi:hypothetical protein
MERYIFPPEVIEEVLSPGYGPIETGYALTPGGIFANTLTRFSHCKGEAVNWYFASWMDRIDRNKIWSPDHTTFETDKKNGPDSVAGATWTISEYIQGKLTPIVIHFYDPAEIMDTSRFPDTNITCALAADLGDGKGASFGAFLHMIRDTYFGCEMRNRFFLRSGSVEEAEGLVRHNCHEMGNLAEFLPGLYARETHYAVV